MRKRIAALLMVAGMLLGLASCKTVVEDTFSNGLKWGNTLSAEQGNYLALRGEKNGKAGLVLFDKKKETTRFLAEGDIVHPAMLGNRIYFKYIGGSELYCYDLAAKRYEELLSSVMAYQVHGDILYYITDEHGPVLYTYNVTNGEKGSLSFKHTVDAFWITDHGIFYHDDAKNLLIKKAFDKDLESIVHRGILADSRDVVALSETEIAFFTVSEGNGETVLYTYNSEGAVLTKLFTGKFTHYNRCGDRLVFAQEGQLLSLDPKTREVFSWGTYENYYPQLLSDCVVLYGNENGTAPILRYYPTK